MTEAAKPKDQCGDTQNEGERDRHECRELTDIEIGQLAYLGEVIHWIGGDEDAASETLLEKIAAGALAARGISDADGEPHDIPAEYFGPAYSRLRSVSRLDDRLVSHHGGVVVLNHEEAPFATWKSWKAVGVEVSAALALWKRKGPSEKTPRKRYDHDQLVKYLEELIQKWKDDKGPRITYRQWWRETCQERFPGVSSGQSRAAWDDAQKPAGWVQGRQKKG